MEAKSTTTTQDSTLRALTDILRAHRRWIEFARIRYLSLPLGVGAH